MAIDVLDLLLDEDAPVPKKEEATSKPAQMDELDLLMDEFKSAPDAASQKEALMAMLQILKK